MLFYALPIVNENISILCHTKLPNEDINEEIICNDVWKVKIMLSLFKEHLLLF
jgi:hypothetical protein